MMSEDGIAGVIDRGSAHRLIRRSARDQRRAAGVITRTLRSLATPGESDDRARWLDGQVQGWAASRSL